MDLDTAGIYCRLSPRPDGSYEGVDAQERWGRDYAAQHWPGAPVRVFSDAGISAANGDERPGYEALRAAVRAGEITHVWCVEQSRLERREGPWFELAAELDSAGISLLHTNRDGVVRVRDAVAGIKAVIYADEVRKLKRRINDKLGELAAQGRPSGGAIFGYRRGRDAEGGKTLEIVPEQAAVIREAAELVLSGWSLTSIAAELRARGVRGALGRSRWDPTALRRVLTSPTVSGMRVYRGQVVGAGCWEPIIAEATRQQVKAKLSRPRTVASVDGRDRQITARVVAGHRTVRRYELTSGLAVCAVCAAPLVAALKTRRNGAKIPYYMCQKTAGGKGCVAIMSGPFEAHVADRLFAELDRPEFLAALGADDHAGRRDELAAQLAGLDVQRAELAGMWAAGSMNTVEWQAARVGLDQRERSLRAELGAIPMPPARVDIGDVRGAWDGMTLGERREILTMFIDRVTVGKGQRGAREFDPTRVKINWRTL